VINPVVRLTLEKAGKHAGYRLRRQIPNHDPIITIGTKLPGGYTVIHVERLENGTATGNVQLGVTKEERKLWLEVARTHLLTALALAEQAGALDVAKAIYTADGEVGSSLARLRAGHRFI
jgi:hypothetical protein